MITLTWKTSVLASAIHAAKQIVTQTDLDFAIPLANQQSFREPIAILPSEDAASRTAFIESAVALSFEFRKNRIFSVEECWAQLLEESLGGQRTDGLMAQNSARVNELGDFFRLMYPKIEDQLALRSRPIQEFWFGFGRGLMAHVKRLTEPDWLIPQADAVLVQPFCGGAGVCYPNSRVILVEALLTNACVELPEVLRVTWLASQLGATRFTVLKGLSGVTELSGERLTKVLGVAMMMCTLAAGEVLELCRCDEATVAKAIDHWIEGMPPSKNQLDATSDLPDKVPMNSSLVTSRVALSWWETYLQTRPSLPVGLLALDKMLQR